LKKKPFILASGASSMDDVQRAVEVALDINPQLALLQCNTNYTASLENFRFISLNVLRSYRLMYPDLVLGLSDHTLGHATVLGAVALGARIIEKHFTDDTHRNGPDHAFSMDAANWKEMVVRTRELELSLGTGCKRVEANEAETVILQRRSIRLARNMQKGETLVSADLSMLRPCPPDALPPYELDNVIGHKLRRAVKSGEHLRWLDLD
jgi:N-acetylneuraminate synthase